MFNSNIKLPEAKSSPNGGLNQQQYGFIGILKMKYQQDIGNLPSENIRKPNGEEQFSRKYHC